MLNVYISTTLVCSNTSVPIYNRAITNISVLFPWRRLELPWIHPLEAGHHTAWFMGQRSSHAVRQRVEYVKTDEFGGGKNNQEYQR